MAANNQDLIESSGRQPNSGEVLILAQSAALLSRSLAYTKLAGLHCGDELAIEIRNHLDVINSYAAAKGLGADMAVAMLELLSGGVESFVEESKGANA